MGVCASKFLVEAGAETTATGGLMLPFLAVTWWSRYDGWRILDREKVHGKGSFSDVVNC